MSLGVGLFGAGRIGNVHAQSIRAVPGSKLIAVSDVVASAAETLAAEHGARSDTVEGILGDDAIDVILVASSTNTHADLIEAGIAAGKAVFCEKPIDLSLSRATACLEAVRAANQPVMMGFNRRFDPNFAAQKAAFDGGEIGKGELLAITSFDPAPPPLDYIKVSGGLFRDMAIHDFDLACWIFGETPETVSATGSCLVDPQIGAAGDIDTAVTTLRFSGGRLAVIRNSRRAAFGYDQRMELLGENGLLSVDNVLESTVSKASASGVTAAKPKFFFLERYMRAYEIEWAHFTDAIAAGRTPLPGVQDGVNALAIAEAANLSHKEGRTVSMSEITAPGTT